MEFTSPLTQAVLLKRYKRFLAEIVVNNQEHRLIYCPNMGPMTGCDMLGSRIWFSRSPNPNRKFPDTWELVEVDSGFLVCVNNQNAYRLVLEGIENQIIAELQGYKRLPCTFPTLDEFTYDFLLEKKSNQESAGEAFSSQKCYVQIKSVTLGDEIHRGFYPECLSEKGSEQLKALIHAKNAGHRAMLIYCVQHTGIDRLFPADHIDPNYGKTLRQALLAGVEILAYRLEISLNEMHLAKAIEVRIPARMICSSRS